MKSAFWICWNVSKNKRQPKQKKKKKQTQTPENNKTNHNDRVFIQADYAGIGNTQPKYMHFEPFWIYYMKYRMINTIGI